MQVPRAVSELDHNDYPPLKRVKPDNVGVTKDHITDQGLLEARRLNRAADAELVDSQKAIAATRFHAHVVAEDAAGIPNNTAGLAASIQRLVAKLDAKLDTLLARGDADASRRYNAVAALRGGAWRPVPFSFPDVDVGDVVLPPIVSKDVFLGLTNAQLKAYLLRYTGDRHNDLRRDELRTQLLAELGVPMSVFKVSQPAPVLYTFE